jgi:hypothetical protein
MELQLLDELRQKENTRYTERQLRHICSECGARCSSSGVSGDPLKQRYLILRRNSHNSVFDKTLTYLSEALQRVVAGMLSSSVIEPD